MIRRHIASMLLLIAAAMASGIALVPSERERWTMFARDGRNEEARQLLEARYNAGGGDSASVLQLYKLLMADAQIPRATQLVEELAANRPNDIETLTLLAKHYGDTQDRDGQARTLERMFVLDPSPKIAESLLSHYRLDGAFGREEKLLHTLLAKATIGTSDAERLGLLAFAHDDLDGALEALAHFDAVAAPERMTGRFALFDLLVRRGDTPKAFSKASDWIVNLRKANLELAIDPDGPVVQLVEWMNAVDPVAARRHLCGLMHADAQLAAYEQSQEVDCSQPVKEISTVELLPATPFSPVAEMPIGHIHAQSAKRRLRSASIQKAHASTSARPQEQRHSRGILRQHRKQVASHITGFP